MNNQACKTALFVPFYFMLCDFDSEKQLCKAAFKNEPAAMNNQQNTVDFDFKDYDLTYPIL